jgi:hypothetical protein
MVMERYIFLRKVEGLPSAAYFAGRDSFRTGFGTFLNGRDIGVRTWIISGIRRVGKTSLKQWCENQAKVTIVLDRHWDATDQFPLRSLRSKMIKSMRAHLRPGGWASAGWFLLWDSLKEVPKLGPVFHKRDLSVDEFTRWFYRICGQLRESAVVICCDKLSETHGHGLTTFLNLSRALDELSSLNTTVRCALVGTTLPGWQMNVPQGVEPHDADLIELEPMSPIEVGQLVDCGKRNCSVNWTTSEDFSPGLYRLTGGFPQLAQRLGYLASRNAERQGRTHLNTLDLEEAWDEDDFLKLAYKQVRLCGFKFPLRPSPEATLKLLKAFGSATNLSDEDAAKGVRRIEWKRSMKHACNLSSSDFEEAFERVFKYLARAKFLRKSEDTDLYSFHPIRLRPHLSAIAEELRNARSI